MVELLNRVKNYIGSPMKTKWYKDSNIISKLIALILCIELFYVMYQLNTINKEVFRLSQRQLHWRAYEEDANAAKTELHSNKNNGKSD